MNKNKGNNNKKVQVWFVYKDTAKYGLVGGDIDIKVKMSDMYGAMVEQKDRILNVIPKCIKAYEEKHKNDAPPKTFLDYSITGEDEYPPLVGYTYKELIEKEFDWIDSLYLSINTLKKINSENYEEFLKHTLTRDEYIKFFIMFCDARKSLKIDTPHEFIGYIYNYSFGARTFWCENLGKKIDSILELL